MNRRSQGLGRTGRQLAAVVLIFALLLPGMTFAVATGRLAADATGDRDWAGFELCRHSGGTDNGGSAAQPGSGPESPAPDRCCVLCLAGANFVLGALAYTPAFHTIIRAIEPWTFTALRLPTLTVDASARPRGPPAQA
jgi:hypothetical protein